MKPPVNKRITLCAAALQQKQRQQNRTIYPKSLYHKVLKRRTRKNSIFFGEKKAK
jgi:hypothetical protein